MYNHLKILPCLLGLKSCKNQHNYSEQLLWKVHQKLAHPNTHLIPSQNNIHNDEFTISPLHFQKYLKFMIITSKMHNFPINNFSTQFLSSSFFLFWQDKECLNPTCHPLYCKKWQLSWDDLNLVCRMIRIFKPEVVKTKYFGHVGSSYE